MTVIIAYVFPLIAIGCGLSVLIALFPFVGDLRREIRGIAPK